MSAVHRRHGGIGRPRVLITGGAGFVGTNLTRRLLANGEHVRVFDSLARAGSEENIHWLQEHYPQRLEFMHGDVRDRHAVCAAVDGVDHIVHLAAQVAVTTSLREPRLDFEVNAYGTLNVLEAARSCAKPPSLVFSSTNKVYGVLSDVQVRAEGKRYVPINAQVHACGISEARPLDFHSPYGCSKGAAEQYVLDYARSYGLRTLVLRMSCIYGPHQHGNEDQGWVAHFVRAAIAGEPITVYGDGLQVRDVLFVEDLVNAFERGRHHIDTLHGRAFNIGGGAANTVSLLELFDRIERLLGRRVEMTFEDWRTGDQRYYVSDVAQFRAATGWKPRTALHSGLVALCNWFDAFSPAQSPHGRRHPRGAEATVGAPT